MVISKNYHSVLLLTKINVNIRYKYKFIEKLRTPPPFIQFEILSPFANFHQILSPFAKYAHKKLLNLNNQ